MTAIHNVNFRVGHIPAIGFRLGGIERALILAPDHQQMRLILAHPRLPLGIGFDVGPVVVEEVALNIGLAWLVEKIKFIRPEIRVMAFHVGIVARMARLGGLKRQEIFPKGAFIGGAIGPKGATRFPILAETGVVRDRVLDD